MTAHTDRFWRERVAVCYLDALDAGDLDAIAALWEQATDDPQLESLLRELDEGLDIEEGPGADFASDTARVLELARRHLPSAFPPAEPAGPLIVADVARRLEAEPEFRRFDTGDRVAHGRLLANVSPVPDVPSQSQFDRWLQDLGIVASSSYRRAFRKVALLLDMARGQQVVRLAAAREAAPPSEPKAPQS